MNRKINKQIIAFVVAICVIAVFAVVYFVFSEKTEDGLKHITIEIVYADGSNDTFAVDTDAKYLKGAMDDAEGLEFSGKDGMLYTINGEFADYFETSSYWYIWVNDEAGLLGYETQPIKDKDSFKIINTDASEFSY